MQTSPLMRLEAYIPSIEAMMVLSDFITSVFLFAHYSINRSRALLALASGYLYTALIVIPHLLSFPGAFSPTGLLGADLQTTAWLYDFWHTGFPVALLAYAWLKDEHTSQSDKQLSALPAISLSAAIVFSLVCSLTWLATQGHDYLPRLFQDRTNLFPLAHYVAALMLLICAIALILL
jgi:membrane-associated sensor protein